MPNRARRAHPSVGGAKLRPGGLTLEAARGLACCLGRTTSVGRNARIGRRRTQSALTAHPRRTRQRGRRPITIGVGALKGLKARPPHAPARRAAHGACARKNGDRTTPGTPDPDRRGHQGPTLWRRPQNEREERRRGHHRQGYSQRDAHPQGADEEGEEGDEGGALLPSRGLAATAHITDDEATTVPTRGRNRAGIACRPRADGTNVAARDRTQDNRAQAAHSIETPQ